MQGNLLKLNAMIFHMSSQMKMCFTFIRFVDVIHTDILPLTRGGLGMPAAIGHVDFYPVSEL